MLIPETMFKIQISSSDGHIIFLKKIANIDAMMAISGLVPLASVPLQRSVSQKQVVAVPVVVQPLGCVAMQCLQIREVFESQSYSDAEKCRLGAKLDF